MPLDRRYLILNPEQTNRMRALAALNDEQLAHPVGEHYTVAVTLAHIAYWDGRTFATMDAWRHHSIAQAFQVGSEGFCTNDARLEFWRALPPREAVRQAI